MEGELHASARPVAIFRTGDWSIRRRYQFDHVQDSLLKMLAPAGEPGREGNRGGDIDLRTLRPLDTETMVSFVRRTHRAVIIHERSKTGPHLGGMARILESETQNLRISHLDFCTNDKLFFDQARFHLFRMVA